MTAQADSDLQLQLSTIPKKPTCRVPANKAGSEGYVGYVQANFEPACGQSGQAKACVASSSGLDFSGLGTTPSGDWHLAPNVDTNDGHVVSYVNTDFWKSAAGQAADRPSQRGQGAWMALSRRRCRGGLSIGNTCTTDYGTRKHEVSRWQKPQATRAPSSRTNP